MQLGFVSAILPELSLEEVCQVAQAKDYDCVELCCWPVSKAERRYSGVTHVDVSHFGTSEAERVHETVAKYGVTISGLGYYPNPLSPNHDEAHTAVEHIKKVIHAAALLGVRQMNTFIGRDWTKSVADNWLRMLDTWGPLVRFAEQHEVRIGIENCPMLFGKDEWPGGKNLATCPALWRKLFEELHSLNLGLNYDPSHLIWQQMDYVAPLREFKDRLFHIHAKDARIDRHKLNDIGILAHPNDYHTPKLPGLGDVDWGQFFSALTDAGYRGPVCVEVEDRAFEETLDSRKAALRQSATYLRNFIPRHTA
jgi:sugar phosphate isomerase/epimerase